MVDPKPHAVYVTGPKPASGAQGVVEETVQEGGVLVEGQLSPLASGYALERYGVEALRPHQFLVDPDDARHFRRRGRCEGRAAGVDPRSTNTANGPIARWWCSRRWVR